MAISEYFIRYLEQRDSLSPADARRLAALDCETERFAPGEVIVPAGVEIRRSCMMSSGMSMRVHQLVGRETERAISAVHVPGDFVDLHGFVLSQLDHSVVAVGPAVVEFVSHEQLRAITEDYPHLTRLLWMATTIDAAIHRRWLVAASSLRSSGHLAHFLCEVFTRLRSVGAADETHFTLPFLQRELGEILGYSAIHINRAVRELKDRGLVEWSGSKIILRDWPGLVKLGHFDAWYLDLRQDQR